MQKERHKIIPAIYLVLVKGDEILMLRRCNTGYEDGNYSLVAGHADGDETIKMAMVREAEEESGICLDPACLDVVHMMHRLASWKNGDRIEYMDFFLKTKEWKGEITNMEPHKCDDLRWFKMDQIPMNTIPYIRQALECINNNELYSEYGFDRPSIF